MRKIITFMLTVISMQLYAQNYPITTITISLPANPDAMIANWGTSSSMLVISANTTAANLKQVEESKILVTINKGAVKACGSYTSASAPNTNFNSINKVWSGNMAVALLGQDCVLAPGEYEICVQIFSLRNVPISDIKCKSFTIKEKETEKEKTNYSAPQAINPADGTVLNDADVKKTMTFLWIPVVPRPKESVIYKVKVFEILQGQTASTAKATPPILEKEVVSMNQFVLPSLSSLPIAEGSSYGWYVQAVNREGKPYGENNGNSNVNTFSLKSSNIFITDFQAKAYLCTDCAALKWNFNLVATKVDNNKYNLTGSLGVNLPSIYGVEFQVQSYTYSASPATGSNGVTSLEESGMFLIPPTTINNNTSFYIFNETVSGSPLSNNGATKAVKLLSTNALPNPIPVKLTIGLPGPIAGLAANCCVIKYKVCIKATIFYDAKHCKSCTIIKCFEFTNL